MSKVSERIMCYLNNTGHVQHLRARIREKFDAQEADNCERTLDAIMERAIELASALDEWPAKAKQRTERSR